MGRFLQQQQFSTNNTQGQSTPTNRQFWILIVIFPYRCAGLVFLFWIIPLYSQPWSLHLRHSKGGKALYGYIGVIPRVAWKFCFSDIKWHCLRVTRHRVTRASQLLYHPWPVQGVVFIKKRNSHWFYYLFFSAAFCFVFMWDITQITELFLHAHQAFRLMFFQSCWRLITIFCLCTYNQFDIMDTVRSISHVTGPHQISVKGILCDKLCWENEEFRLVFPDFALSHRCL